jgi:hypothetical protein
METLIRNRRDFLKTCALTGVAATLHAANTPRGKDDRKVRLGFIGVGGRGSGLLADCVKMPDVEITAVCDVIEANLNRAQAVVEKAGGKKPAGYSKNEEDFLNLLKRDDVDGVVIATPWEWHLPMAIAAMKAGKYAAPEVAPASSVEECWELVRTYEATRVPCMMLENYCYNRGAMAILNMVRKGLFGELIHCQCGYEHDLRQRIVEGKKTGIELKEGGDYRSHHNRTRNGDIYPTHGVGPMANCLNIDRGNRFVFLTSTASKSRGLQHWTRDNLGADHPANKTEWAIGDIVTSVIKCHHGETIMINHEVTLPRPSPAYPTIGRVQGTKGIWDKSIDSIFFEKRSPAGKWEQFSKYQTEFEHPLWQRYGKQGVKQGHGGTDHLALSDFVSSIKDRLPTPIDVYDTASWMVIAPLSEQSIASGSNRVEFPDFTRGKWRTNKPIFGFQT